MTEEIATQNNKPEYDGPDWFGDPTKPVPVQLLKARFHAMVHDASHAMNGDVQVKIQPDGRPISYHFRPHPKKTYTDEERALAKELDRIFGNIYFHENTTTYEEILSRAKALEHIVVQKGYAKHSDPENYDRVFNANTRDINFKPFASLVKSMTSQESRWRELVDEGTKKEIIR